MRVLRALFAVLLLTATTLGASLHSASGHAMTPASGGTHAVHDPGGAQLEARGHFHATSHAGPCQDCPTKAFGSLCDIACAAAVAVAATPSQSVGTPLEYAVAFAVPPSRTVDGAVLTPDPFPPRPSPIG